MKYCYLKLNTNKVLFLNSNKNNVIIDHACIASSAKYKDVTDTFNKLEKLYADLHNKVYINSTNADIFNSVGLILEKFKRGTYPEKHQMKYLNHIYRTYIKK